MAEQGFRLDVRSNIAELTKNIDDLQKRHIPFVTAFALTKTAQDIKGAEVAVIAEVFDRPTRFTLNALYVKPATKQTLTSAVLFKEGFGSVPAWRYLGPQVEGGSRVKKSHERALERAGILKAEEFVVPGEGVNLDAFGNMRGGDITRILSALGANPDAHQNMTTRSRATKRGRARGTYFLLRGRAGAPDGIYHRKGMREIVPVMVFVRQPRYAKRFPFRQTALTTFQRNFARRFREGWQTYVVNQPVRRAA